MMIRMTAKAKIAVTLPAELVRSVRAEVRAGRAPSVSAYVAGALAKQTESDDLDDLLVEMLERSGGPLTDSERARIDREAGWQAE